MNNNKKLLRVLLGIILFIPAYFAVYNIYIISTDTIMVENITKIEITRDGQLCAEYTDADSIKLYIKTLDNAMKDEVTSSIRNLDYELPFVLTFYKGDKQILYGMYMSLNKNDCLIKTSEDKLLHMNDKDAERILNTDLADALYPVNNLPIAKLIYEGENPLDIFPKEGEWMLKKPDGKYRESTVPNRLSSSPNKAKAYQDKQFNISFYAEPSMINVEPDMLYIEVKEGNVIIFNKDVYSSFIENFSYDSVNDLQYIFEAEWTEKESDDNYAFYGKATYVIDVRYSVPVKFEISQTVAEPGDIVAITAYNTGGDGNLNLTTDIGYETKFVRVGDNSVALIPISPDFVGKTYNLTVTSDVNEPVNYSLEIKEKEIQTKNYGASDENLKKHLTDAAKAQKQTIYNDIFSLNTGENEKSWTDSFAMPCPGNILLNYGWKVTINMGNAYINNGVNIGIAVDEPVKAANTGKVIYAGEIPDDGKIIIIDHGMGIKTWYTHLGAISVNIGDGVLKGQQIGTGGSSGMPTTINTATVKNLYFAVSIGNIFVDPVKAVNGGIPGIDNMNDGYGNASGDLPQAAATTEEEPTITEDDGEH